MLASASIASNQVIDLAIDLLLLLLLLLALLAVHHKAQALYKYRICSIYVHHIAHHQ
jgi:hypothetical protein